MDLENINSSYLIFSSDKLEDITSILYAKEYKIIQLKTFLLEEYGDAIIAFKNIDNNGLREDGLFILNHFKEKCCIIKYNGEDIIKELKNDGSEHLLTLSMYNTDNNNVSYIHNGISFSFLNKDRYWKPKSKNDLKKGMVVEYMNENKWYKKTIENPILEYNNLYALLIKHDKLRVKSN